SIIDADEDVVETVTLEWEDGILGYAEDADTLRDGEGSVTFQINAEPNDGDMWAVTGVITNFTAGDVLDLTGLNLGNDLSLSETISGYTEATQDLDIGLQVGNQTLPVVTFSLEGIDADALGLDVTDQESLVASLENADWLLI
ncbi:hypothetical protein LRB11_17120, partial [Ectothiorhodospira haloalkaliphila]|uniref:hypothetical protein n=1 Tax=Ectothiorhodospira haloalkaliphila TaxID=421628 RepID=UPI001EE8F946